MTSFDHFAFGSIGQFLFQIILGINPDQQHPGFKHFFISPKPGGNLSWASGYFISPFGKIYVYWKLHNKKFLLYTTIPPNTSATISIPSKNTQSLLINGTPLSQSKLAQLNNFNNYIATCNVNPGIYFFLSDYPF
ncbi:MAG: alpha-L-rhamnosidase C-terminal domain-containing protein [Candidatus Helarchaeota archaeon]